MGGPSAAPLVAAANPGASWPAGSGGTRRPAGGVQQKPHPRCSSSSMQPYLIFNLQKAIAADVIWRGRGSSTWLAALCPFHRLA